jgi:hypothetical protein
VIYLDEQGRELEALTAANVNKFIKSICSIQIIGWIEFFRLDRFKTIFILKREYEQQ